MKAKVKNQRLGILWSSNYSEQEKVFSFWIYSFQMFQDYNASLKSDLTSKGEKRKNNKFQREERDKTCLLETSSYIFKRKYYF